MGGLEVVAGASGQLLAAPPELDSTVALAAHPRGIAQGSRRGDRALRVVEPLEHGQGLRRDHVRPGVPDRLRFVLQGGELEAGHEPLVTVGPRLLEAGTEQLGGFAGAA
jgi:hypothetical protein